MMYITGYSSAHPGRMRKHPVSKHNTPGTALKRRLEPRGIEPRFAECDSAVIPLDHGPGGRRTFYSTPYLRQVSALAQKRALGNRISHRRRRKVRLNLRLRFWRRRAPRAHRVLV